MTKAANKGNIRLKKLMEFAGSTSLGITLPRAFVRALDLRAGQFVKCELLNDDKTVTVEAVKFD